VAGGSSSAGNARVCGIARNPDGTPCSGAAVRLRPHGYISDGSFQLSTNDGNGVRITDDTADTQGKFIIDSVAAGDYFIEINCSDSFAVLLQALVPDVETDVSLGAVVLCSTVSIRGRVKSDDSTALPSTAYMENLEQSALVDSEGVFRFDGVPAHAPIVRIIPDEMAYPEATINLDSIAPGEIADLGTITIEWTGCQDAVCDSLSLLAILAKNNVVDYEYDSLVSRGPSGRTVGLNLSGLDIFAFPREIGYFSELRELRLDSNDLDSLPEAISLLAKLELFSCSNNRLNRLPEAMCNLLNLEELNISQNSFFENPGSLPRCYTLKKLYLNENAFAHFPKTLILDSLRVLEIAGNALDSLNEFFIAQMKLLESLNVSHNSFTYLSEAFFELTALQKINAANNEIADLPSRAVESNVSCINIDNNRLCNLSDESLKQWLDTVSETADWESRQCN